MADFKTEWYSVDNIDDIDSPALLVYEDRIKENIRLLTDIKSDKDLLRPHVKTNKMSEVSALMMQQGLTKFKCATIAEAEMLAMLSAPDVLLAYQPVGPKAVRFIHLIKAYPATRFSCLVDNEKSAVFLNDLAKANHLLVDVFIDLNIGMNRTGILPSAGKALADSMISLSNLKLRGLHAYDGHIRDTDIAIRKKNCDSGFDGVLSLQEYVQNKHHSALTIVAGGTPTFPIHAKRNNVECSPGTFVFSDWGYKHLLPDEPFDYAALVLTRVVSIVNNNTICTDLGHKSVAAENPLPQRVYFLNAPHVQTTGQSEEHLVLKVDDASLFNIGDVLYGVPLHICPTVALYEKAIVIENHAAVKEWSVVARNRFINI
ncbi:MAG: D-TA family PLP-dependent enzyme [Agriterribacter sp.]